MSTGPEETSAVSLASSLEELFVALATRCKLTAPHAGSELSFAEGRVLMTVGAAPRPVPIHVIAEHLDVSVATAGRTVDRLVREGVVSREECAEDRRVKLVAPTAAGRAMLAAHLEAHQAVLLDFASRLPVAERDALDGAIRAALATDALPALIH